jgi:hypothetical protein
MELPVERAEWDEVVVFAGAKPWQTAPAMYVSSVALAQRAIGIVNTCLRNEAEYRVPSRREAYRHREYQWRDESTHNFAADPFGNQRREGSIRGRNQGSGEANAFRLVSIQQGRIGALLNHVCELPAEVDRIADSGIHSLTAYWAVDVPRVAQKKGLSHAESFGDPMVNTVCREPVQFRDLDIELTLYSVTNIVKREIGAVR